MRYPDQRGKYTHSWPSVNFIFDSTLGSSRNKEAKFSFMW
jgi:hypothetical protein